MSMSDDLFGDFRDDSILEHLDDEMESTRFPSLLSELNVLLRQELTRLGYDPRHSVELVAAICSRIGGMQLYFPRGYIHHILSITFLIAHGCLELNKLR